MEIETLKSVKQPKSIEIVAAIDDLLTEILFRLPTEPLIRCQLVSKHWQSLITNPQFRRRRNLNPVPAAGLFFLGKNFQTNRLYDYIPFSLKNSTDIVPCSRLDFTRYHPLSIRIIQSCNGLFLCSSISRGRRYTSTYYVCHPTTYQFTTLPSLKGTTRIHGMSLAFDPARSSHYKVVCVSGLDELVDYPYQIRIYSSKTGSWKKIGKPLTIKLYFENGVYWNSAIHWINEPYNCGDFVYFNVHHHALKKMPKPPLDVQYGRTSSYFGESCDHLHYIHLSRRQTQFNVYEMKSDYSEWFVKYSFDLSLVAAANHEMVRAISGRTWFFSTYVA